MKIRVSAVGLVFFLATGSASSLSSPASAQASKSFSAVRVEYMLATPDKVIKSRIFFGPVGLREETTDHNPEEAPYVVVITNARLGRAWMLAPGRRIFLTMPESAEQQGSVEEDFGSVFSDQPCDGYSRMKKLRNREFQGHSVEEWECLDPKSGRKVNQYYSRMFRIVVREQTDRGRVEELRRIREDELNSDLFVVPAGFRQVSMKEFFTGAPEFPRYEETAEDSVVPEKLQGGKEELPGFSTGSQ